MISPFITLILSVQIIICITSCNNVNVVNGSKFKPTVNIISKHRIDSATAMFGMRDSGKINKHTLSTLESTSTSTSTSTLKRTFLQVPLRRKINELRGGATHSQCLRYTKIGLVHLSNKYLDASSSSSTSTSTSTLDLEENITLMVDDENDNDIPLSSLILEQWINRQTESGSDSDSDSDTDNSKQSEVKIGSLIVIPTSYADATCASANANMGIAENAIVREGSFVTTRSSSSSSSSLQGNTHGDIGDTTETLGCIADAIIVFYDATYPHRQKAFVRLIKGIERQRASYRNKDANKHVDVLVVVREKNAQAEANAIRDVVSEGDEELGDMIKIITLNDDDETGSRIFDYVKGDLEYVEHEVSFEDRDVPLNSFPLLVKAVYNKFGGKRQTGKKVIFQTRKVDIMEKEAEHELEAEIETELELESEAEIEAELELESEAELELESEAEIEAEIELESEAELELESEAEIELESEAEIGAEAEVETFEEESEIESDVEEESLTDAPNEEEQREEKDMSSEEGLEIDVRSEVIEQHEDEEVTDEKESITKAWNEDAEQDEGEEVADEEESANNADYQSNSKESREVHTLKEVEEEQETMEEVEMEEVEQLSEENKMPELDQENIDEEIDDMDDNEEIPRIGIEKQEEPKESVDETPVEKLSAVLEILVEEKSGEFNVDVEEQLSELEMKQDEVLLDEKKMPILEFGQKASNILIAAFTAFNSRDIDALAVGSINSEYIDSKRNDIVLKTNESVHRLFENQIQSLREYYGRAYEAVIEQLQENDANIHDMEEDQLRKRQIKHDNALAEAAKRSTEGFSAAAENSIPMVLKSGKFEQIRMKYNYNEGLDGLIRDMMQATSDSQSLDAEWESANRDDSNEDETNDVSAKKRGPVKWYEKLGARVLVFGVNYLQGWLAYQGIKKAAEERNQMMPKFPLF